ncbi:MAG: class I SAM-dependent methyltransferase [Akkermansiaceae bacterium]
MEYKDIFNHRGDAYHEAMQLCPDARREEFLIPLRLLDLKPDAVIYDFPSGGCYVRQFLPKELLSVRVNALEVSSEFASNREQCLLASWVDLPIQSSSADGILSLAALHHTGQRAGFYSEAYRALKVGGRFVIGDVEKGTAQDSFLNGFVNEFNSMGHDGDFLVPGVEEERLLRAGFSVTENGRYSYLWEFDSEEKMISFCRGLFGLDLASDAEIMQGVEPLLTAAHSMQWSLRFIRGVK